jgi:elongation factor G
MFFINKLDKENTDFKKTLEDIQQTLSRSAKNIVSIDGKDVAVLLKNKDKDADAYGALVESIAETNDALLEKYLETGSIGDEEIVPAFKKAVANGQIFPVAAGSLAQGSGIDALLELIVDVMPSVAEMPPRPAKDTQGDEVSVEPKTDGPFCARVFKTVIDPFVGQLTIFRVLSGTLASNTEFFNATKETKEKFGQLYFLEGKQQIATDGVCAGDIAAVAKLKDTSTQDVLTDAKHPLQMQGFTFPSPAYSASVKPKTRQDEDKISAALSRLTSEDPTLRISRDAQTKELIISGMGELHLQIVIQRMKRKYQANVELGTPKVPYLETITKSMQVSHKYKKQTGGRGQYGDVSIEVAPLERGKEFEFVDKIVGGAIPRSFIPSVEKGIKKSMSEGIIAGFPVTDVQVTLFDGSYHSVDSSDIAFQIAGSMAFKKALEQAGSVLLEPIMDVEITVPEELMGQITGDINGRRGRVLGMESKGKNEVVKAQVPLSEMFKYASDLRSVTGGRGSYSMNFSHYEIVPSRIAQNVVNQAKTAKQEV